jgi:hypothetical protein
MAFSSILRMLPFSVFRQLEFSILKYVFAIASREAKIGENRIEEWSFFTLIT